MRFTERKLQLIQRFMELNSEDELLKVEEAISHLELNRRAQASEADIVAGSVEDYQKFNADLKQWMSEKRRSA